MPIIPSIDLVNGHAVQLVGGKLDQLKIDAGDPIPIAKKFRLAGEIAVVDLDAAIGTGKTNKDTILALLQVADCRVGGGIRSLDAALYWLNAGASKIVLGTAATPELLSQLPKERLVAALDAVNGEVVVEGWVSKTGKTVFERIQELKPFVSGFLVTFVEKEGKMQGFDLELAKKLKIAVGNEHVLTIAGGVTTVDDVMNLHKAGIEAQVGMALYSGKMDLGQAIARTLTSDRPDNLIPTVVIDQLGTNLGLVYSNEQSIMKSVELCRGVYFSRKRGLWLKGESSGDTQELLKIQVDCDSDALCFVVKQNGKGFCHLERWSCFGNGHGLSRLTRTIEERKVSALPGSYTNRLFSDANLLNAKIEEEAKELIEAKTKDEVAWEAADLLYFTLVKCASAGVSLSDVEAILDKRALQVTKRKGDAKVPLPPATTTTTKDSNNNNSKSEFLEISMKKLTPSQVMHLDSPPVDLETLEKVRVIVDDVRKNGMTSLLSYATKFGDIPSASSTLILYPETMKQSFESLSLHQQNVLLRTAQRIRRFAQAQRDSIVDLNMAIEGGKCGHKIFPIEKAGCYAPGGRFPLPSSVLMTAITARVAGVKSVWVASPRPSAVTIAAAYVAGADALLMIGGAQAIAALAYGVGPIPACEVLVGPGNKWVTAAKQLVSGTVKIDMLAGPSECLVIGDDTSNPEFIAADLLAQAEHDPDARPILISINDKSSNLIQNVEIQVKKQLETLPEASSSIAIQSFRNNSFAVMCSSLEEVVTTANKIAAEHLEVHVAEDSWKVLSKGLVQYGGLFVSSYSAEVFGDYGAGPNHVLPTGATARYSGGLSVFTFLAIRTFLEITDPIGSQQTVKDAHDLALMEGLSGHANAAKQRMTHTLSTPPSFDPSRYLRADLSNIGKYKPVKPLDVLAQELHLHIEDLVKLDANENLFGAHPEILKSVQQELVSSGHIYPDPGQTYFRATVAQFLNKIYQTKLASEHVVGGTGSDDLLDVLIRVTDPKTIVISSPTFGMYSFLGKISKAKIVDVPRNEDFSVEISAIEKAIASECVGIVFLASPNNPTGNILENSDIKRLCHTASLYGTIIAIDEAYTEFASQSAISLIESLSNLIVFRTFSKWAGLAGLRVGYCVASSFLIEQMIAIKQPYNLNALADVAARAALANYETIKKNSMEKMMIEKKRMMKAFNGPNNNNNNQDSLEPQYDWLEALPSESNFILVRVHGRAAYPLTLQLRKRGILIRYFGDSSSGRLCDFIRISCGREQETNKLFSVLKDLEKEYETTKWLDGIVGKALIFDMDGVLADVSKSYRTAIKLTAQHFGVTVTDDIISTIKSKGNANNDWELVHNLLKTALSSTILPSYPQVIQVFEEFYQGSLETPGLKNLETFLTTKSHLKTLSQKVPLGIVTGRPRKDCMEFLDKFEIRECFTAIVCMEDSKKKPDPAPVMLCLEKMNSPGVTYMIGDTPDDIIAAKRAQVIPLGIVSPGERGNEGSLAALWKAGAANVVSSLSELDLLFH